MKFFDLTFSGTVLPERDPGQVRLALAKLFAIENSAELDELFSGRTVVLRHNLDRKSAAEFFSKIADAGGKAVLVESEESADKDAGVMNADTRSLRVTREHKTKQNSKNAGRKQTKPIHEGVFLREKAELPRILSQHSDELDRVRTLMSQMKERSRTRYLELQSRREAFECIADRELALAEQASIEAVIGAQSKLADLRTQEEKLKHDADDEDKRLTQEQDNLRLLSRDKIAALEALTQDSRAKALAMAAQIEARREERRNSAEKEISRLQQLLLEAKQQAETDDRAMVEELENVKSGALLDGEMLEQQRIQELDKLQREIESLLRQQTQAKSRFEADTAVQVQLQQEIEHQCREESSQLSLKQLDIRAKRDRGIAEVDQASAQLEAMTRKNLKKLYAMELHAKRRLNEAGRNSINPDSADAAISGMTSH